MYDGFVCLWGGGQGKAPLSPPPPKKELFLPPKKMKNVKKEQCPVQTVQSVLSFVVPS